MYNSLLAELPKNKLLPLQSIQDLAARLIHRGFFSTDESKFRLHLLPIYYRMRFKTLLLVFNCLQGNAPVYNFLQQCIHLHVPGHSGIRRTARSLRVVSSRRKEKRKKRSIPPKPAFQKRAFTNYAPQSWNTLPPAIRTTTDRREFKMLLKTHFFTLSYPSFMSHHWSGALYFFLNRHLNIVNLRYTSFNIHTYIHTTVFVKNIHCFKLSWKS